MGRNTLNWLKEREAKLIADKTNYELLTRRTEAELVGIRYAIMKEEEKESP